MRKFRFAVLVLVIASACFLSGCGGPSYTVLSREDVWVAVSYEVQVDPALTLEEAIAVAGELANKESKHLVVVMYDGPNNNSNVIFTCTGSDCLDVRQKSQ